MQQSVYNSVELMGGVVLTDVIEPKLVSFSCTLSLVQT